MAKLINTLERSYNGIQKGGVVETDKKAEIEYYLSNGFSLVQDKKKATEKDTPEKNNDIEKEDISEDNSDIPEGSKRKEKDK